jgi:hypothetical protein
MKKRNQKNLSLNKKAVSNLVAMHEIKGGQTVDGCTGFTSFRPFVCKIYCESLLNNC